jgi:hypothetical protein
MIELRIVENELGMKPDIQYRHHMLRVDANGALCPPPHEYVWSEWKTAPYVNVEEIEND